MAVVAITTATFVFAVEYDMDRVMEDAKKEILEELKQSTINGASSRRFARKKITEL